MEIEPYVDDSPRGRRTAEIAAIETMELAEELWLKLAPGGTEEGFDESIAEPLSDDVDIECLVDECIATDPGNALARGSWPFIEQPIRIAYANAIMAQLAYLANANDLAWTYIEDATYWHGLSIGLTQHRHDGPPVETISAVATRAAHVRNAEHRAIMASAFEWLD